MSKYLKQNTHKKKRIEVLRETIELKFNSLAQNLQDLRLKA